MQHSEWLAKVTDDATPRAISKETGISFRTVNEQRNRESLSAENVIRIAEAYGVNPVRALVDTRYLDAVHAESVDPFTALRTVSDEDLADEVLRRMKVGGEHPVLSDPIDNVVSARRHLRSVADSSPDEDAMREEQDGDWTAPDQIP